MWSDVRIAMRRLLGTPPFTVTAVLQLALGIGGATFMFCVVRALLFQPIPYRDPAHLVVLSQPVFDLDLIHQLQAPAGPFDGAAAYTERAANLVEQGDTERALVVAVTREFLPLTGTSPSLGRLFTDDEFNVSGNPVAILAHRTWIGPYGAAPNILGQEVVIDGRHHTIVGVLPPSFKTLDQMKRVHELPVERELGALVPMTRPPSSFDPRRTDNAQRGLSVIAHLRPGTSVEAANQRLAPLLARAQDRLPPTVRVAFVPLDVAVTEGLPMQLSALTIAVAVLLITSCANVLNLLLIRLDARTREIAVSLALGATGWRVATGVIVETLLISVAGGGVGLLLASQAMAAIRSQPVACSR